MPLAFESQSHGKVAFGFFNIEIDLLLLDAEKGGFTDYLDKLLPLVRAGGLIIAHDSSGQAHMMHDYFQAIASNPDLETAFVDASRWGTYITRK